jgi:hypothetical protein
MDKVLYVVTLSKVELDIVLKAMDDYSESWKDDCPQMIEIIDTIREEIARNACSLPGKVSEKSY